MNTIGVLKRSWDRRTACKCKLWRESAGGHRAIAKFHSEFRRDALSRLGSARMLNTPGIVMLAIRTGIWAIERFVMSFTSFRDVFFLSCILGYRATMSGVTLRKRRGERASYHSSCRSRPAPPPALVRVGVAWLDGHPPSPTSEEFAYRLARLRHRRRIGSSAGVPAHSGRNVA